MSIGIHVSKIKMETKEYKIHRSKNCETCFRIIWKLPSLVSYIMHEVSWKFYISCLSSVRAPSPGRDDDTCALGNEAQRGGEARGDEAARLCLPSLQASTSHYYNSFGTRDISRHECKFVTRDVRRCHMTTVIWRTNNFVELLATLYPYTATNRYH